MMVCRPVIDGAARLPSVLMDLSAINPSLMMLHYEKFVCEGDRREAER
jgi:hypothetical protein